MALSNPPSLVRRSGLSVTLWAFGFATTILLIGLWGRSASTDRDTIAETTTAVVTSGMVVERVTEWVEAGLADSGVATSEPVDVSVERILAIPEVRAAVDDLVAESVTAIFAGEPTEAEIDVAAALSPASPRIATELGVDETVVRSLLATVDPIDLSTTAQVAEAASAVHGALTWIAVLAAFAMTGFGAAAVVLAADRAVMVRGLATRVALSAFSFTILFRIGGWLIDPQGGRSPVLRGGSILMRSNGHVFIAVAVAAAVVATIVTIAVRRSSVSAVDGDTRELVAVH